MTAAKKKAAAKTVKTPPTHVNELMRSVMTAMVERHEDRKWWVEAFRAWSMECEDTLWHDHVEPFLRGLERSFGEDVAGGE